MSDKFVKRFLMLFMLVCLIKTAYSQSNIQGVVNRYTKVTGVVGPAGNTNRVTVQSADGFQERDTVLLIQMTGVDTIDGNFVPKNAGNYEFHIIRSVSGTQITFISTILNKYTPSTEYVQLVKVASYKNAQVTGTATCTPWDPVSGTGGVLAFMVRETLTLRADIDASGKGFHGGNASNSASGCIPDGGPSNYPAGFPLSGDKGGGAWSNIHSPHRRGSGSYYNGGGGGTGEYSGGGGGGNGGAGGNGGRQKCDDDNSAVSGRGGEAVWTGVLGHSFWDHTVLMGGGGGAGTGNGTSGGRGGGIVIVMAGAIDLNGYAISANGESVTTALAENNPAGAGGGGAGGSVLLSAGSYTAGTVSVAGGAGGSINGGFCASASVGVGGGGGGGMIWISQTSFPGQIARNISGEEAGYVNCSSGASRGQDGKTIYDLKLPLRGFLNNYLTTEDTKLCYNESITIEASEPQGGHGIPLYKYKWKQKFALNDPWVDAPGQNEGKQYTSPGLTGAAIFFSRVVTSKELRNSDGDINNDGDLQDVVDTSLYIKISVVPEITGNVLSFIDSTACNDLKTVTVYGNTVGGGNGSITYQWAKRIDESRWQDLSGQTGLDLTQDVQIGRQSYLRKAFSDGCAHSSIPVSIRILPPISDNVIGSDQTLCETETLRTLHGTAALSGGDEQYRYRWQESTDRQSWTDSGIASASYDPDQKYIGNRFYRRMVVSGMWDCCKSSSNVVTVHYDQQPSPAVAGEDQIMDFKFNTVLNATPVTVGTGKWSAESSPVVFSDDTQPAATVTDLEIGNNIVQWTVRNGTCPDTTDQVVIMVKDLFIPSGFSPNNDGFNDCFKIVGAENSITSELSVFDRTSRIVYRSSPFKGIPGGCEGWWDGRDMSGKELPNGTYFYRAVFNGNREYKGYVILKR